MEPVEVNTDLTGAQLNKLKNLSEQKNPQQEKLQKAAQDFEAVFISQFLQIVDSTVEREGFLGNGHGEQMFKSMLFQEIAQNTASNPATSFGFAKQVYEQMKDKV